MVVKDQPPTPVRRPKGYKRADKRSNSHWDESVSATSSSYAAFRNNKQPYEESTDASMSMYSESAKFIMTPPSARSKYTEIGLDPDGVNRRSTKFSSDFQSTISSPTTERNTDHNDYSTVTSGEWMSNMHSTLHDEESREDVSVASRSRRRKRDLERALQKQQQRKQQQSQPAQSSSRQQKPYTSSSRRKARDPTEGRQDPEEGTEDNPFDITHKIQSLRTQRDKGKRTKSSSKLSVENSSLDTGIVSLTADEKPVPYRRHHKYNTAVDSVAEEESCISLKSSRESVSVSTASRSRGSSRPRRKARSSSMKKGPQQGPPEDAPAASSSRLRRYVPDFSDEEDSNSLLDDRSEMFSADMTTQTGKASVATNDTSSSTLIIRPLRWTEQETDNLLLQLEFFGDQLNNKEIQRISRGSIKSLVKSIQGVVSKDKLRRDDPILQNLSKALHSVQFVDLDKLLGLLQAQHVAGEIMKDKPVLLLCGPSGAGKTTTLQFLAGTTLEEVEDQGFFHLKPVQFPQPHLKDYETSSYRKHLTQNLQATTVVLGKKDITGDDDDSHNDEDITEIVVCDTPGLGEFDSVEEEISNGLGMIKELEGAKSVHPVLVLSKESLGSRFGNLYDIVHSLRDRFLLEAKSDVDSFNYLFTKYEGKQRTRICKQISVLEKVPAEIPHETRTIFKAVVKDIMKKTKPKAHVVIPTEDDPGKSLRDLWRAAAETDGKDLLLPFASANALKQLHLQMQLTLHDFSNLLTKGDYRIAAHRLHQIKEITKILHDDKEIAEKANELGIRHINAVCELVKEMVYDDKDYASAIFRLNELYKLETELPEVRHSCERTMAKVRKSLEQLIEEESVVESLSKMEALGKLAKSDAQANDLIKEALDLVMKRVLRTMEDEDFEKTLEHMAALNRLAQRLPEASECTWLAVTAFKKFINVLVEKEGFEELRQHMIQLGEMALCVDVAQECIELGFENLRKRCIMLFEAKNYEKFATHVRKLDKLVQYLPEEHRLFNRGGMLLVDTINEITASKPYGTAVDMILGLKEMEALLPTGDTKECIRCAFESLLDRAVASIDDKHYDQSAAMFRKLGTLMAALPSSSATESIKQGFMPLHENVKRTVNALSTKDAVGFLGELNDETGVFPELREGVEVGFEILLQQSTALLGKDTYKKAVDQFKHLSKMIPKLVITDECIQRGISDLDQTVFASVDAVDLEVGVDIVSQLNRVASLHPDFSKCINGAFERLLQKASKSLSAEDCSESLAQLDALGEIMHRYSISDGCIQRGLKEFSVALNKFLEFMEFEKAVDVLKQFFRLTNTFPQAIQCVQLGFELLLEKAVDLFDHKSYSRSLVEMKRLGELAQQFSLPEELTQGNLKCLAALIPGAMEDLEFDAAIGILRELTEVRLLMPETLVCVQIAFEVLLKKSVMRISAESYSDAFEHMRRLGRVTADVPDISNNQRRGLQVFGTTVSDSMQQLDFETSVDFIKRVNELAPLYPKMGNVIKTSFESLLEKTAAAFEEVGFSQGIIQLQTLGQLRQLLELDDGAVKESRRRVLQYLVSIVKKNVESSAFSTALKFVQDLHDIVKVYPEAEEGMRVGFESLLRRAATTFAERKTSERVDQLLQVGELKESLNIGECVGLERLVYSAKGVFEEAQLKEATEIMGKLAKVADQFPEARECVDIGLQDLWVKFERSFENGDFELAAEVLKEMGAFQVVAPTADRFLRKGMKRLRKAATNETAVDTESDLSKLIEEVETTLAATAGTYNQKCELLRNQMELKIREKDYKTAADHILTLLGEMTERVPLATEHARTGFRLLMTSMDDSSKKQDSENIVAILQNFSRLEDFIPEAATCIQHGVNMLRKLMEEHAESNDFMKAVLFIETLHERCDTVPKVYEVVQHGVNLLGKMMEKSVESNEHNNTVLFIETLHERCNTVPRVYEVVQHGVNLLGKALEHPVCTENYGMVSALIQQLSRSGVPKASDCARRGLKGMWMTVKRTIEEEEYATSMSLMRHMRGLAENLPEAGDCVQLAFVAIRVRLVKTIDKQNFSMAMDLMQLLSDLAEDLPEAFECAQFGFEALQERLEKSIEQRKFNMVIEQMKHIGKVSEALPEVSELFTAGFSALAEALSRQVDKAHYSTAVDIMEQLTDLAKERPDAMDCTRRGLFAFWSAFEDRIREQDYRKAVEILQHLGKLAHAVSEAEDGVQLGFEVLEEKFEKMIEQKDYDSAVALMQDLGKLAYELPEAGSCIQNGFEVLRGRLVKIIEQQDYSTARKLIAKLEQQIPASTEPSKRFPMEQSRETIDNSTSGSVEITIDGEDKLDVLRERLKSTIEDKDIGAALEVMMTLTNMEHVVPTAGETLEMGYTQIKDLLRTLVDRLKLKTAQEMLMTLSRQTHRLPVAAECTRFGLKDLQKAVEKRVEQKDYRAAIDLIGVLVRLSREIADAARCAQNALNGAIQHMVILREETSTSFEELAEVKDNNLFAHMLETACENLEAVMATEELRSYCAHLDKMAIGSDREPRSLECALRLSTSESFCSEQVRKVADAVGSDFPELMVEPAYVDAIVGNEDSLLSVLERLSLLRQVLNKCPGATSVARVYADAFEKFCMFLDGVASLAQTEFMPKMNLQTFETQVVLLTTLLNRFAKDHTNVPKDEMKKMEDLEHRRARLMLRFEIEVADSLEVIKNYNFPVFRKDEREKMSAYIRSLRISQVEKYREILLACSNSRELTQMISGNVDLSSADRTLSSFDKSLDKFVDHLITILEEEKEIINALPKTKAGLPAAKEEVQALCRDVPKVMDEVTLISNWPTEVYGMDTSYQLSRLKTLDETVKDLTKKIEDEMNGIGFGAFISSFTNSMNVPDVSSLAMTVPSLNSFRSMKVSDYYSCVLQTTLSEDNADISDVGFGVDFSAAAGAGTTADSSGAD